MKIYTKKGDRGTTGLYGGRRVPKDSSRLYAYGDVDELNAALGVAIAETQHQPIKEVLIQVQADLFVLGSQLATPPEQSPLQVMTAAHVDGLERQIDTISEALPELKSFVLPGGSKTAAYLHSARTICRRAERHTVHLSKIPGESVDQWSLTYLNRLSDFLFILARLGNQLEGVDDVPWSS